MRGQTTLDFAIGVTIFLSAMLVTFAFVPGILEPFELTGDQETIHSERIVSQLTTDHLSDPATPYVLDRYCTVEFFSDDPSPRECNYSGESPAERLNIEPWRPYNISIQGAIDGGDEQVLCWDTGAEEFDDSCSGASTRRLAAGDTPPEGSDATITSRRVVSLEHHDVDVTVVLW